MCAYATVQQLHYHENYCKHSWVVCRHRAGCCMLHTHLLSQRTRSPDDCSLKNTIQIHARLAEPTNFRTRICEIRTKICQDLFFSLVPIMLWQTINEIIIFLGLFSLVVIFFLGSLPHGTGVLHAVFVVSKFHWCRLYYFLRNRLLALLEALCARGLWQRLSSGNENLVNLKTTVLAADHRPAHMMKETKTTHTAKQAEPHVQTRNKAREG